MPNPNSYSPSHFPFLSNAEDDLETASIGGQTIVLLAGTALNVGDAVYLSAANTVSKSTNPVAGARIGIVVGGYKSNMTALTDSTAYGTFQAAAIGEQVLVLVRGISYVILDGSVSAAGAIILGTATAGRVKAAVANAIANPTQAATTAVQSGTTATVPAGATPVTSSSAQPAMTVVEGAIVVTNGAITAGALTGDGTHSIIGMMLEGGTVGQVKKALIYLG